MPKEDFTDSIVKMKNAQIEYLEASVKELQHRPSSTESVLKTELSQLRGQVNMLTFKNKDLQIDLRHQQDIVQSLREQLEQKANEKPVVDIESVVQQRVEELFNQFKNKVNELKRKHAKKMDSLEIRYDEALRLVQSKEKRKYEEMIENYKDSHTEENIIKLQTSLGAMTKKYLQMKGYAGELERRLALKEDEEESRVAKRYKS